MNTFTKNLPCRITPAEETALAKQTASAVDTLQHTKAEKKQSAAGYKAQIDRLEADITRMSGVIHSGIEMREIECETRYDHERATVTIVRTDTWEVVETRRMTQSEGQMTLESMSEVRRGAQHG